MVLKVAFGSLPTLFESLIYSLIVLYFRLWAQTTSEYNNIKSPFFFIVNYRFLYDPRLYPVRFNFRIFNTTILASKMNNLNSFFEDLPGLSLHDISNRVAEELTCFSITSVCPYGSWF